MIEFECANAQELNAIYSVVQGSGIDLQGTCYILEIENRYLDLAATVPTRLDMPAPAAGLTQTSQACPLAHWVESMWQG